MPYPFWDVGLGYGVLMATFAILHVFVSHFAIGGGLYLVVVERSARRSGDAERLRFVRRLSKTFILVTLVFGALTGVGIWFIIGLIGPNATAALIHTFVWGWAIEWTFFLVEITSAILYFYGWDRMSARGHQALGWIYFVFAWLSLVVINGIVTFMLTPGAWLETGGFWDGLFNPTYFPSLVLRTGVCLALAGLWALFVGSGFAADVRRRFARTDATWAVAGLLLAGLGALWYAHAVPVDVRDVATGRLAVTQNALRVLGWAGVALALAVAVLGYAVPRALRRPVGVALLALGLVGFGAFEWARESARKPYVIYGYMYGNGQPVAMEPAFQKDGLLAHTTFTTGHPGADVFRYACASCHTMGGYLSLAPAFAHTDRAFVRATIADLGHMKAKMPPFLGNAEEADRLADWIWERVDPSPLAEASGLEGAALGARVYEQRCSRCHEVGGFNDKREKLADYTPGDLRDLLTDPEGIEGMPVFSGPKASLDALVEYMSPWLSKEKP